MKKIIALFIIAAVLFALAEASADADVNRGDRGQEVTEVQYVLRSFGYVLAVDGIFGAQTDRTVRHFQRANGLVADGIVGPLTASVLTTATAPAVRVTPPPAPPASDGPPDGLDACAEMNWWRIKFGLPERFSDQPREPVVTFANQGYGWRESGCDNTQVSSTGCCVGYWQIHTGNFTAPGYKAGILACGVTKRSDILGNEDYQKRNNACVAKVLFDVSGLTPWRL